MIDKLSLISNSALANIAQNTTSRVAAETALKAAGRPTFILIDNDIDDKTKKYAASKEFLYQATCLAVYILAVAMFVPKWSFNLGKKLMGKNHPEFNKFRSISEYMDYFKQTEKPLANRRPSLEKDQAKHMFKHDGLREALLENEHPDKYPLIRGTIEFGSLIGSVLGLAILAPEIGHVTIHPIMRALGLEKKPEKAESDKKVDTQA